MVHIGIDLGTTYSVVAYVEDGEANIIENSATGRDKTPSAVLIEHEEDGDKSVTVGQPALNQRVTSPEKLITRVKDHMGQTDENGDPVTLTADGKEIRPEEVSSYILEFLVEDAEDRVGEVEGAVVTVPYYFNEQSREATRAAAQIADLNVDGLMNEPTAAIKAYRLQDRSFTGTALIYDLGGGTFDATLVEVSEDVNEVLGTNGARDLGGENFDDALYEYVVSEIKDQGQMDPSENPNVAEQVREAVVTAKEDLSAMPNGTTINLFLGQETFEMELTREAFEETTGHLVDETLDALDELFNDDQIHVSQDDVDEIIMIGGSSRIPLVQKRVEDYFGMEPDMSVNPDLAVAIGAAAEASEYDEDIPGLGGDTGGVTFDVLSHSLGVAAYEDGADPDEDELIFDPILERNQEVPHSDSKEYVTVRDNQTSIDVPILQGEGELADDPENEELATFRLTEIEPRPAGESKIEVTFEVDDEGILHAEAEDLQSGDTVDIELDDELSLDEVVEDVKRDRGDIQRRGAGDD